MHRDTTIRIFKTQDEKFFIARVAYGNTKIIEEVYMNLKETFVTEHCAVGSNSEQKLMPLEEANRNIKSRVDGKKCELMLYETLGEAQVARDAVMKERQFIAIVLNAKPAENYNQL